MSAKPTSLAAPAPASRMVRSESPSARLVRRTLRNRGAQIGAVILLVLIAASLGAPILTSHDPNAIDPTATLQPPSREHPMGTDHIGRDVFARFLYGGRLSLRVGLIAIALGATLGVTIGLIAGYYGGWLDAASSWVTDVLLSFPDILLALAIIAVLGPGIVNAMLAIGIAFIPSFMRLTRGNVLAIREMDYVEAARAIGASDHQILIKHILPNALRTLLVLLTLGIGSAILAGAALSFLGLGAQPPTPEWGAMLNAGQKFIRQAWWLTVFPGLGIFLTVLAINLIGDALSDAVAGATPAYSNKAT
ncbi:ABC transporter permease [Caldilinea sp.]|uniref:ABC transporter permease n=1 Tax=Caldilinea sp. TaxID=2293560 RepID=UPI002BFDA77C|nr:ABC transporter permease [Caldilinea sp.]